MNKYNKSKLLQTGATTAKSTQIQSAAESITEAIDPNQTILTSQQKVPLVV